MEALKEKILKEGFSLPGNILKVDSFVNHQIDPEMTYAMGAEFAKRFSDVKVDRILTVESSGIAMALTAAHELGVKFVFARKHQSALLKEEAYSCPVHSFTHKKTSLVYVLKKFLHHGENILIIDDFLADGNAAFGLINIAEQAGCNVVGVGIGIEKSFQNGRSRLEEAGYRVESLARIKSLDDCKITFVEDEN